MVLFQIYIWKNHYILNHFPKSFQQMYLRLLDFLFYLLEFYPKIQFPKTPNTYFRLELLLELSIEMFFFSDLVDRVKGDFPEQ